jgi:hypothetical protein
MLKTELERRLKIAEGKADDLSNDRIRIMRELSDKDKEIKNLNERVKYNSDRMKEINQSIYTILRVKYPDTHTNEPVDDCEDKRFLIYIHELSNNADVINSASALFNHLGRS